MRALPVVVVLCVWASECAADDWVRILAPPDGSGGSVVVYDVNDMGLVTGRQLTGQRTGAWISAYGTSLVLTDWFPSAAPYEANAVNSHNIVVGMAIFDGARPRGFWFDFETATLHEMGTLGGQSSTAYDINDAGDVVGSAGTWFGPGGHAVLWTNGATIDLTPDAPPGTNATGMRINNAGRIVGKQGDDVFLWVDGVRTPLPDIYPTAMNNYGDILCTIRNSGGVDAIWREGVVTPVPDHPDATICDWTDIADDGTIVGYCYGGALGPTGRAIAIIDGEYLDFTPPNVVSAGFYSVSDSGGVLAGTYSAVFGSTTETWAFTISRRGDMNWDGVVDFFDIDLFLLGLFSPSAYQQQFGWTAAAHGDANGDGTLDFFDVDPFLAIIFDR